MVAWALLMASGCASDGSAPLASGAASPTVRPSAADAAAFEIRPVLGIAETNAECTGEPVGSAEQMTACDADGKGYTLGPAAATAADVISAEVDPAAPAITIQLGPDGATAFLAATTYAIDASPPQDQVALVSDGAVLSAAAVRSPISDGRLQVFGLGREQAVALAARLSN